jgi:hypothetical protein
VRGLLMVEWPSQAGDARVTIVSVAGKHLPVPARVRQFPLGLSPDARMVAGTDVDAVDVGPVRGGSTRTLLRGNCPPKPGPVCSYGIDPSFAWSRNSGQLAAAANPPTGATMLKIFDRNGKAIRSFKLPAEEAGVGAYLPQTGLLVPRWLTAAFDSQGRVQRGSLSST